MSTSLRIIAALTLAVFCRGCFAVGQIKYQISGLPAIVNENVEKSLDALLPEASESTQPNLQHYYLQIPKQIRAGIQPYGYFRASIHGTLKTQGKAWLAHFLVKAGPRMQLEDVDVQWLGAGRTDAHLQSSLKKLPIKAHEYLNTQKYNDSKQLLYHIAQVRGYIHAKLIQSELHIDLKNYRAMAILHMDTGAQYRFGQVRFVQHVLKEKLLRRMIPFKTGDVYNEEALSRLQRNLLNSGYFSEITVKALKDDPNVVNIPILVQLKGRKNKHYAVGGGFATDTGPRLSLGMKLNKLNKRGHRLNFAAQAASQQNRFQAQYIIPGRHPITDQYSVTGNVETSRIGNGDRYTQSFSIESLSVHNNWQRTMRLTYLLEHFQLPNKAARNAIMLMPNLHMLKTHKDHLVDPDRGYTLEFDLRGAAERLFSSTSFIQGRINWKGLTTLAKDNRFIGRLALGVTNVQSINRLPLSQQFRTGGSASIRGYGFEQLGPGRYLLESSVEYQRRIKDRFYLAAFFDMGNAMNEFDESLRRGVGLAAIWRTPVGAIRVGAARGLDADGKLIQLFFSMGPEL